MKALEALALRAGVPVDLQTDIRPGLPDQLEAAAYFVVAEGLANTHKHAGASSVAVRARTDSETLVVEVLDDGVGGANEEAAGCAAWPTGSKHSAGRWRWRVRQEAVPASWAGSRLPDRGRSARRPRSPGQTRR